MAKSLGVTGFKKLKVFRSWREIVSEAIILLEYMNTEAYIASRFFEPSVSQAAFEQLTENAEFAFYTARGSTRASVSRLTRKTTLAPEATRIFTRIVEDPLITLKEVGSLQLDVNRSKNRIRRTNDSLRMHASLDLYKRYAQAVAMNEAGAILKEERIESDDSSFMERFSDSLEHQARSFDVFTERNHEKMPAYFSHATFLLKKSPFTSIVL